MGRLSGKVAIITGAASGMGLAGAQLFAKEGAKVVAADIAETLEEKVEEIVKEGGEAIAVKLDVTKPESWQEVVDRTIETYGKIDVLVNNAGIHIPKGILEAELDDWNLVMAVNTTGVWLGMKAVIPHMQKNGGGSIINTSSIRGHCRRRRRRRRCGLQCFQRSGKSIDKTCGAMVWRR